MSNDASHEFPAGPRFIQRGFAWFLSKSERQMERTYGATKAALFAPLRGETLEIGPGTGVNFPYYPAGTRLTGVEPNPFMSARLQARAEACGLNLQLVEGHAERLPVEDASVDAVVSTLVLCSVFEPARVLGEVRRVLRPGGRFVFLEHVAAEEGSGARRWQERLHRPWRYCGDGCNLNRETWRAIERAGFSQAQIDYHAFETPFRGLLRRHIAGWAIK